MQSLYIPSALRAVLDSFRDCFTRPSFENFVALVTGWILCPGRHTISRVVQAARGTGRPKHHATLYRFLSRGRWVADELGRVLLDLLWRWLPQEIEAQVDDTLCQKSGPHFFGAGMHHDASRSTYGGGVRRWACFAFGHNWVVLSVWLPRPWCPERGWAVPILFRLYRPKKLSPKTLYRKRTELARELVRLLACWLPEGRSLHVTGDGEYACKTLVRDLPDEIVFTGPMAMDAALYAPPEPYRGKGRKPLKGARLPSPKALAVRKGARWRRLKLTLYGKKVTLLVLSRTCLWYTVAGTRLVRLVITKDPKGQAQTRAYFCTDPKRSVAAILITYAHRWDLEVAFRNAKQALGLGDPQNGWWRRKAGDRPQKKRPGPRPRGRRGEQAVLHTAPLVFAAYAVVLLWYLRHGRRESDIARARRNAPWYRHKKDPSFWDMLAALRRKLWAERVSAHALSRRVRRKAEGLFPLWLLAA